MSPYSRPCGRHTSDCAALVCTCAKEPHTPTQAEREAFWADGPCTRTPERPEAGREPHSKPRVYEFDGAFIADFSICCGESFNVWRLWHGTWAEAMDAAHAHVREHHALTSANHTPTWEPCGRGICAANAGHEGTCEEASGFVDWTPEFYDEDLDVHKPAKNGRIVSIEWLDPPPRVAEYPLTVTYTRDDPDPSADAWRGLLATSREDA